MAQASGGGKYGTVMLVNVLRGSKREEVRRLGFDKISTWGLLKEHSAQNVREMINFLISENYLRMENSDFPVLSFTERTMPFLRDATPLIMRRTEERAQKEERLKKRAKNVEIVRSELFEELRALRRAIASEEGVPPYVVFTDRTLSAICDMLPTDEQTFLEVPGVGAAKLERYGEAFIDAVNDWKGRQG
ncbi:ATP-dependent DNA helicase RecQ [bioreactor metagenome]